MGCNLYLQNWKLSPETVLNVTKEVTHTPSSSHHSYYGTVSMVLIFCGLQVPALDLVRCFGFNKQWSFLLLEEQQSSEGTVSGPSITGQAAAACFVQHGECGRSTREVRAEDCWIIAAGANHGCLQIIHNALTVCISPKYEGDSWLVVCWMATVCLVINCASLCLFYCPSVLRDGECTVHCSVPSQHLRIWL